MKRSKKSGELPVAREEKPKPLNTHQLSVLRSAELRNGENYIGCDRSTGMTLVARGFAAEVDREKFENTGYWFRMTAAGAARAKKKADIVVHRDGQKDDPTLMQDLCPACNQPFQDKCLDCLGEATASTEGMP